MDERVDEFDKILSEIPEMDDEGNEVEQPEDIDIRPMLAGAYSMMFDLIASRSGPHWKLTDTESQTLAGAHGDVLDKYFPNAGQYLGCEVIAIAVTAQVFAPRVAENQRLAALAVQSEPKKLEGEENEMTDDKFGLGGYNRGH